MTRPIILGPRTVSIPLPGGGWRTVSRRDTSRHNRVESVGNPDRMWVAPGCVTTAGAGTTTLGVAMREDDSTPEEWRAVVGWEGLYEVSSFGRVRSLDRVRFAGVALQTYHGRVLKPIVGHAGYVVVHLRDLCRTKSARVHRVVAEAFIGPEPAGHAVLHGDGNKLNNTLSNLRYGTPKENSADCVAHGMNASFPGSRNGQARVTEADIPVIRSRYTNGETLGAIARDYGLSKSGVHLIVQRRNWSHVA